MRPLLALIVAGAILGGLQLYMRTRPQPAGRQAGVAEHMAEGHFSVELTLTFDAGPDAFAVDLADAAALLVRLRGREILRRSEAIAAGQQLRVDDVAGVVSGHNEFYVQATPRDAVAAVSRAVRVRILRDGHPIADQTLWAEPGEVVQGAIVVDVPAWVAGAAVGVERHGASTVGEEARGD
jgi:hypothetical protein